MEPHHPTGNGFCDFIQNWNFRIIKRRVALWIAAVTEPQQLAQEKNCQNGKKTKLRRFLKPQKQPACKAQTAQQRHDGVMSGEPSLNLSQIVDAKNHPKRPSMK